MPNHLVLIVGGSSFDIEIKELFERHNLYIGHYDARKSSSLKKQNVPKNTLGVIITVDRSHMTFGNSNELTRQLQASNIPFVFSSSNLATFNSAKLLLQKMSKLFPDNVKIKEYIPLNVQKLDQCKQEWEKYETNFIKIIDKWFEIESDWQKRLNEWEAILENWKIYILEWKEIQSIEQNKELKKKIQRNAPHLIEWKVEIHDYGLKIEKNINLARQWKTNIEDSSEEFLSDHEILKNKISKLKDLNDKSSKAEFRNWKIEFEKWKENMELWEKQYLEWLDIYPQAFLNLIEWQNIMLTWFNGLKRFIEKV